MVAELEAVMSRPIAATFGDTTRSTRPQAEPIEVNESNGFTRELDVPLDKFFAHDAVREGWPEVAGTGSWPRNFVAAADTVPIDADFVLGQPVHAPGFEVIVRRTEAASRQWTARTINAAHDRLTKPARPSSPNRT